MLKYDDWRIAMICDECKQLAPRTLAQLDNRLNNIALGGNISIHHCPRCKGIEYMTSDVMIKNVPPLKYRWRIDHNRARNEMKSLGYLLVIVAIVIATIWFLDR